MPRRRVAPDMDQLILPTDVPTCIHGISLVSLLGPPRVHNYCRDCEAAGETLLPPEGTHEGETAYDIGLRHGTENHEYYPDTLPKGERQAYSRGYARGQVNRNKET